MHHFEGPRKKEQTAEEGKEEEMKREKKGTL